MSDNFSTNAYFAGFYKNNIWTENYWNEAKFGRMVDYITKTAVKSNAYSYYGFYFIESFRPVFEYIDNNNSTNLYY